jgi:hypothetical protein
MQILHLPSLFGTMMMGEPHVDVLGLITPISNNCYTFLNTSSASMKDYLYSPMLGSGGFGKIESCVQPLSWVEVPEALETLTCRLQ